MESKYFLPNVVQITEDMRDRFQDNAIPLHDRIKIQREMILVLHSCQCAIREVSTRLEILNDNFQVCHSYNPIHYIESRLKSPKSIWNKLEKNDLPCTAESAKNNLTDIAGIRVISHYFEDVYAIADLLTSQDDIQLIKKSDYIANPKPSGYRSLHIVISVPVFQSKKKETVFVEVQFLTIAMDYWASLEHELNYKTHSKVKDDLRNKLHQCAVEIHNIELKMGDVYKSIMEMQ
jgi:putative GTP pyrophosphokinase